MGETRYRYLGVKGTTRLQLRLKRTDDVLGERPQGHVWSYQDLSNGMVNCSQSYYRKSCFSILPRRRDRHHYRLINSLTKSIETERTLRRRMEYEVVRVNKDQGTDNTVNFTPIKSCFKSKS